MPAQLTDQALKIGLTESDGLLIQQGTVFSKRIIQIEIDEKSNKGQFVI
ncbi:hypothetical protein SDC9_150850 [bioreactor metagenome]|uniref:Uncharacterized protein n=1 Tax=bioreactor metagenome TaxID=1076179 RepID=A0A645ER45_9ZZZZ